MITLAPSSLCKPLDYGIYRFNSTTDFFPFIITLTPTACSHSYTKQCPSFFTSLSVVVSHNALLLFSHFLLPPML